MKKLILFLCCGFFTNIICAQDTLTCYQTITKRLELEFNQAAIDYDAFIEWALIGDWEDFKVTFNQGTIRRDRFIIKANNYKAFAEGNYGIVLTLKPRKRASEGYKKINMEVAESGPNLDIEPSILNLQIPQFYYLPPMPDPWWIKSLYVLAIAMVLFLLVWFLFIKRKLFPKMTGTLQFSDGSIIKLNNTYCYILYTALEKPKIAKTGLLSEIFCGKKGSCRMPYPENERSPQKYIIIKTEKGKRGYTNRLDIINGIEFLSHTKKLYHKQEYSFKDPNDDMVVSFLYDNEKHQL